jgi:hypothetical protein
MRPADRPSPGELLLHAVPICGIALLLLNDHVLKGLWRGWVTGRLSDVAGLVFFPLFLHAVWEFGRSAAGRFRGHSRRALVVCIILTAIAFTLVKTWVPANDLYRIVWGAMQWPFRAAAAVAKGGPAPAVRSVRLVLDPTDLMALPALAVPFFLAIRRIPNDSNNRG